MRPRLAGAPLLEYPRPEYPRPVMPAGLTEDQQDAVLDRLMTQLLTCPPERSIRTPTDVQVRVVWDARWGLDDDVIEF